MERFNQGMQELEAGRRSVVVCTSSREDQSRASARGLRWSKLLGLDRGEGPFLPAASSGAPAGSVGSSAEFWWGRAGPPLASQQLVLQQCPQMLVEALQGSSERPGDLLKLLIRHQHGGRENVASSAVESRRGPMMKYQMSRMEGETA